MYPNQQQGPSADTPLTGQQAEARGLVENSTAKAAGAAEPTQVKKPDNPDADDGLHHDDGLSEGFECFE